MVERLDQAANDSDPGKELTVNPGGVWIFSPAGKHVATIVMPEIVSNLNGGGSDGRSLFITASSSV